MSETSCCRLAWSHSQCNQGRKGYSRLPRGNSVTSTLWWVGWRTQIYAPQARGPFVETTGKVFTRQGRPHKTFPTWGAFEQVLCRRSAEILWTLGPGQKSIPASLPRPLAETEYEVGPAWPHTHTLDVLRDGVFLRVHDRLVVTEAVTISGSLRWERRPRPFEYYVLEYVGTNQLFAGAAIADWGASDGRMFAVVFASGSNALNFHQNIELPEKHRNAIRQLRIPRIGDGH